jgi:hypothetical protein
MPALAKVTGIAYDTELADRIRFLIGAGRVSPKRRCSAASRS